MDERFNCCVCATEGPADETAVLPKLFDVDIETVLYGQAVGINGVADDVNLTFCQFLQFLSFESCFWLLPLLLLHLSISLPLGNVEKE